MQVRRCFLYPKTGFYGAWIDSGCFFMYHKNINHSEVIL